MSQGVRIPEGFVDELKARIRPSDVIGRKVKLTRKGKEWVGLSPFTAEKTPSFYVNDQKRIFKCFSSGMGGDVINFVMETERLSFFEAVEKLAEEAGMSLPKASPAAAEEYDHRKRLQAACEAAAAFFEDRLRAGEGAGARAYLEGRGLDAATWARHRIGYSPDDWRRTREHLKALGFTDAEILEAGLTKESDKGGEPYDAFRGRLMFPIHDARGGVIAFGGRALTPDAKPKYLNSGDTPLFQKSHILYRYKAAREALGHGDGGGLIVCEGYMDAIALAEAGFGQAVAPLGTALTEDQLQLIWRAGPEPVLCFDGDKAGLGAAHRAIDRALPFVEPGRSLFFVLLPDGLDPDDLIRARGAGAMAQALAAKIPLSELLWRRERDAEPLNTPERQAGLEARLMAACALIKHPAVRQAYERDLRGRVRDHLWELRQASRNTSYRKRPGKGQIPVEGERAQSELRNGLKTRLQGLGLIFDLVEHPELFDGLELQIISADFEDQCVVFLRNRVLDLIVEGKTPSLELLLAQLQQSDIPDRADVAATILDFQKQRKEEKSHRAVSLARLRRQWALVLQTFDSENLPDATSDPGANRRYLAMIAARQSRKLQFSELAVEEKAGASRKLQTLLARLREEAGESKDD